MHVDDDTDKTIGQYGQNTIPERKPTFHTTCVAPEMRRSIKGEAMRTKILKNRTLSRTALYFDYDNLDGQ